MLNLYTTYFSSEDRQLELDKCIKENIDNSEIHKIFVFISSDDVGSFKQKFTQEKIKLIEHSGRPSYFDWIESSVNLPLEDITIFANADIYFDSTIGKVKDYLQKDQSIMCLSRYELDGKIIIQPEWSQDVWAIKVKDIKKIFFKDELRIKSGTVACDNKVAGIFALKGWNLFNPFSDIKAVHVHSSLERNYSKVDVLCAGCLAAVHGSNSPENPSEVSVHVMPVCSDKIKEVGLNIWLEENLKAIR